MVHIIPPGTHNFTWPITIAQTCNITLRGSASSQLPVVLDGQRMTRLFKASEHSLCAANLWWRITRRVGLR